tara:strand:- start:125 stop:1870 length:1746 start_codon:yes stop_codon:yes gene_type:complete
MILLGLLSLLQIWFIPGLILLVLKPKFKIIDILILCLPLSMILNHYLVILLVILKLYTQTSIIFIILIEFILLSYLLIKNKNFFKRELVPFFRFIEFKKVNINFDPYDFIILFLFLIFFYIAIYNVGNVVQSGDPVTFYNWSIEWVNNLIPKNSYDYPQLPSILSSLTYVVINSTEVDFFSTAIFLIYPFWIFLICYRLCSLFRKYKYIIKLSFIFTLVIILYNFRHYALFNGLPDPSLAFLSCIGFYLISIFLNKIKFKINFEIIIISLIMATPALMKQYGIFVSAIFPFFYYFFNSDRKDKIKNFFLLSILIFIFFSPWYLFKYYQILILGTESSMAPIIMNFYESSTIDASKPLVSMKNLFGNFYIFIIMLIILSLKNKIAQKVFLFFLLPYFLIYSFLFGLDYRAFSLAMPATGFLCAIGIYNLYLVFENKFEQEILKKAYFSLIFLIIISFLIGLNHIRNSDKLYKISLNKKEKRGNPELNFLLYKNLNKDDLVKDIFVFRDVWNLSLLPNIDHRFYSDLCSNLEEINQNFSNKKYYILIDKNEKTCSEQNLLFLNKLKKTKIFDHQNFLFFLIEK